MSCSQIDVKAHFLGELDEQERRLAEDHLRMCGQCREELERLRLTQAALISVPEEEMPRRIAFVSDPVFEPRGWRRWLESGPKLGFASAAMLAAAILVHAFVRPAAAPVPAAVDLAAVEARVEAAAGKRLEAAVQKAVAEERERQTKQTAALLAALERRLEERRQTDILAVEEGFKYLQKKLGVYQTASSELGVPR